MSRKPRWDWFGVSAAEVGLVFTTVVLVTGPIWAKPVWGIWWTWDARLTTTLVLWLIYVGYMMLRAYSPNRSQAALYSAEEKGEEPVTRVFDESGRTNRKGARRWSC